MWYCWLGMIITFVLAGLATALIGASYLTNPFSRFTIIKRPYVIEATARAFEAINNNRRITVRQGLLWRWFAIIKCGVHILNTRYLRSPRSQSRSVEGVIADIHRLRFDPEKLLLISGDHFSALFVRNLGVFYYPMLDRAISGSEADWHDRQTVYIQTVAYALGVFEKNPVPTTTIVSTGAYRATCVNFYAYPSDTVYGILYALAALMGKESAAPVDYARAQHRSGTKFATALLVKEYKATLRALYQHYRTTVFDQQTGLINTRIHLSGAKDITRRTSSFYDNVIFWKTSQLAMTLGVIRRDNAFLDELKARILDTFWLEDDGYFLEDLSEEGLAAKYYSSDWLIILATGFLDPADRRERKYFVRSVDYIQEHKIDQPMPIKYQNETRAHRQFFAVRMAVASYGGDAIWSFWGMEYLKTLMILSETTGKKSYLKTADTHIATYEKAMLRDGGFPEVYDPKGKLLQTPLYRSIRQTGWVIGFEQVREMRAAIRK